MYYPYLRGKRHELSALRRIAPFASNQKFRPIIEPVKKNTKSLKETLILLNQYGISPVVIINPLEGELKSSPPSTLYSSLTQLGFSFLPCVAFTANNFSNSEALVNQFLGDNIDYCTYFKDEPTQPCLQITNHSQANIIRITPNITNSFVLNTIRVVKLSDSFNTQVRNADYPLPPYVYSDAHLMVNQLPNIIGFGDYQIIGEPFSESGGPARAVALHITYIEPNNRNLMHIKHCVSTTDSGTTSNTAIKFLEALDGLIAFANSTPAVDQTTLGFIKFRDLYSRRHYPNLGPAKEHSVIHHMESIIRFL
jgi:hypothetical protein